MVVRCHEDAGLASWSSAKVDRALNYGAPHSRPHRVVFLLKVTEKVGTTELALDSVHRDTFFIYLLGTSYQSFHIHALEWCWSIVSTRPSPLSPSLCSSYLSGKIVSIFLVFPKNQVWVSLLTIEFFVSNFLYFWHGTYFIFKLKALIL